MQDKACHPEMIPHVDRLARPNLELPLITHEIIRYNLNWHEKAKRKKPRWWICVNHLSWHHFSICATNLDSSIQTCSVMGFHNIPAIGFVSSHTTVVWACKYTNQ